MSFAVSSRTRTPVARLPRYRPVGRTDFPGRATCHFAHLANCVNGAASHRSKARRSIQIGPRIRCSRSMRRRPQF